MRITILAILWLITFCTHASELHPSLESLQTIPPTIEPAEGKEFTGTVRLVPLGFSPSGQFAYFMAGWDDACGECPNFSVVDLINDTVIVRDVWEDRSIEQVIEEHGEQISSKVYASGITALEDSSIKPFPLIIGEEQFSVSIESDTESSQAPKGNKEASKRYIRIHSSIKGSKVIGTVESEDIVKRTVDKVEGYLLSPHENRIVVVTSGTVSGFEFAYLQSFYLFGSHLNVGFSGN